MKDPMEEKLRDLPRAADEAFGGLQATQGLRNRILEKADEQQGTAKRLMKWLVPALSCCGALIVAAGLFASGVFGIKENTAAGTGEPPTAEVSETRLGDFTVTVMGNDLEGVRESADVRGNVTISQNADSGSMLLVDGRYYCRQSGSVSAVGDRLGEVRRVSNVSGQTGICSDCLSDGAVVYSIPGMEGTAVAADENGTMRLFRRTSYAGVAVAAGETLTDTLRGDVVRIQIGDRQPLDGGDARRLMDILSGASFVSSAGSNSGTALTITYSNGVKLKLYVSVEDNWVMGCGTWSCPGFFSAYADMAW